MRKYLKNSSSNYDKTPYVEVGDGNSAWENWNAVITELNNSLALCPLCRKLLIVDTYQGVYDEEILEALKGIDTSLIIKTQELLKSEEKIKKMTFCDVTDDEIFGYITRLTISDFFDSGKLSQVRHLIEQTEGTVLIYGPGAAIVFPNPQILVYADMARWEIQLRFRQNKIANLGMNNHNERASIQYKKAFFVDWRVCDTHKKAIFKTVDYFLDTNTKNQPKMVTGKGLIDGLKVCIARPFRVVPFFDPGPWGGQWMKEVCGLDPTPENYAWCFDCVPEENSLFLKFGNILFETPSINVVFQFPAELLGDPVHARFGDEFPIRFDLLDTMQGGNLSLQVHPLTEYIQEKFGIKYTQDESYYILEAEDDACVYLGLRDDVNPEKMVAELIHAQESGENFDADKHVQRWPVKKHDHVLIPGGTVHCSGKNSMVLEISATPYIFTFKLWDWGRLGLDGRPRPINIEHGKKNIQWNRTKSWSEVNIRDRVVKVAEGDGWMEEKTGLHEREFIETRRFWFTKKIEINTGGSVNVLNLVEGREIIVESPDKRFDPFIVHYAETFIVPASVGDYTITPYGESEGQQCAIIKASIRY